MGDTRFASIAERAQGLDGFAQTLGPISTAGRYKLQQNSVDGNVYSTVNGGAWVEIIDSAGIVTGGATISLQSAYEGGASITTDDVHGVIIINVNQTFGEVFEILTVGAPPITAPFQGIVVDLTNISGGLDNLIYGQRINLPATTSISSRALVLSSRQTAGSIMEISVDSGTVPSATGITGLSIDMSNVTLGSNHVCGLSIVGGGTLKSKFLGQALLQVGSRSRFASSINNFVRNTRSLAGSLWHLGWDTESIDGGPATSTILDAQTYMVTLDGISNVDASTNNVDFVNLYILTPQTTNDSTYGILISSVQCAGSGMAIVVAPQQAATSESVVTGQTISITPTGAFPSSCFGQTVTLSGSLVSPYGACASYVWDTTVGTGIVSGLFAVNRVNGICNVYTTAAHNDTDLTFVSIGTNAAFTPLNPVYGIVIDYSRFVLSTQEVHGMYIWMPATTSSAASGIVVTGYQTAGKMIDCTMSTSTLTGALTGITVNLSSFVNGGSQTVTGVLVSTSNSTASDSRGIYVSSSQSAGYQIDVTPTGSFSLSGTMKGLNIDFSGLTPSNNTIVCVSTAVPAAGSSGANVSYGMFHQRTGTLTTNSSFSGSGIAILNTPARASGVATEAGTLISVTHAPTTGASGALTDTTIGIGIAMTPVSSAAVHGGIVTMGSSSSSSASAADFIWNSAAGTNGITNNGIANVYTNASMNSGVLTFLSVHSRTANLTATGAVTGVNADLSTNITVSNQTVIGFKTTVAASGSGGVNISYGLFHTRSGVVTSGSTFSGSGVAILNTPTEPGSSTYNEAGTLLSITHAPINGAGTCVDTTVGIGVAMTPNVSAAVIGHVVTMATNTSAAGAAATYIWNSAAGTDGITSNAVVNVVTNSGINSGKLTFVNVGARNGGTLTITNSTTGFYADLNNNMSHGNVPCSGFSVNMGASSHTNTSCYSAVTTQTAGTIYTGGAAGTLASAMTGVDISFSSSTPGNQTIIGFKSTMPANGSAGANISYGFYHARSGVVTAGSTFSGSGIVILNTPTEPGSSTYNEAGTLISITHAPVNGAGTCVDTTTGVGIVMTPNVSAAVVGQVITIGANGSSGSAGLQIANSGSGAHMQFTTNADGTGHLVGPTTGSFAINAGSPTSSAAGKNINVTASAANTSGIGGSLNFTSGAGANASNGGDITMTTGALAGAGRRGYTYINGAFAETQSTVTFNAAGTSTVNCGNGNAFTVTATGATTWAFSKPMDTGYVYSFTLALANGAAGAQTWTTAGTGGTAVKWSAGTVPTLSAGTDILVFTTWDGGVTWYGALAIANAS